jgi:hypothetical protein
VSDTKWFLELVRITDELTLSARVLPFDSRKEAREQKRFIQDTQKGVLAARIYRGEVVR